MISQSAAGVPSGLVRRLWVKSDCQHSSKRQLKADPPLAITLVSERCGGGEQPTRHDDNADSSNLGMARFRTIRCH